MIAEVIIQSNAKELNKVFDYNIPTNLEEKIKVGSRVLVPFGNVKTLEDGFVIGIKENSEYKVKDIANVQEECINNEKIELAESLSELASSLSDEELQALMNQASQGVMNGEIDPSELAKELSSLENIAKGNSNLNSENNNSNSGNGSASNGSGSNGNSSNGNGSGNGNGSNGNGNGSNRKHKNII